MGNNKTKTDNKTELRKKAEEKLKKKYAYLRTSPSESKAHITQELWVHQIEMEMQNEELRKAQHELEESRHKYADLFDFAPMGYFVLDENGSIQEVNLTGTTMVGVERNMVLKKPFSLFIHKDYQDSYYLNLRRALKEKTSRRFELKMVHRKDKNEFDADVVLDPVTDDSGKVTRCRIAVLDITKRKKIEEELGKVREDLERRVKEKTVDLLQLVTILRREIEQRGKAELSLQKKTRDLDAFFSGAITPLVILDSKFNIIRLNKAYADAWKRNISDFEGRNYFEFCTSKENKRIFKEVLRTKKPHQTMAMPFVFPDHPELGETFWDWNLAPVLDTAGKIELLALSLKDVTENIKSHKALEESEKKYRTLIEVSPDAICVAVADKIVFANNTAAKILKAKNIEELIGKSVWQFVKPDSLKIIREQLERFCEGKKDAGEMVEITLTRTDGSLVEAGGTAATVDYEGNKGVLIIFQDISLRKRQEATLRRIKSRLAEAQRIAQIGNWDLDIVNNTLWLSDESYRILGTDPDKFGGSIEAMLKFVHPEDRKRVKDTIEESVKHCKPYDIEHRIVRQDGLVRFVHKRAETECDIKGKALRMVGTIQDITDRKKAENQLVLSRQKLRTLAAKMEMIEEQERRRIASDLHDSVGQILAFATRELKYMRKNLPKKQGDALLEIAEQLDKAVGQTRTLSFDLSPSILYDIGFEIAVEDLVEKFAGERKINCVFDNDHHPKPLTIPLKVLLYRSIRELLMNIAKHANAKNIKVSLNKVGDNIQVTVKDDGQGFDVSEFEKGEKAKGFGLFHIRERIEHTGGGFNIESAPGKGTKTVLTVPLGPDAAQ